MVLSYRNFPYPLYLPLATLYDFVKTFNAMILKTFIIVNDGAILFVLEFLLLNPFDKQLESYDKSKLMNRVIVRILSHLFLAVQTWLNTIVDSSIDFPVRKNW